MVRYCHFTNSSNKDSKFGKNYSSKLKKSTKYITRKKSEYSNREYRNCNPIQIWKYRVNKIIAKNMYRLRRPHKQITALVIDAEKENTRTMLLKNGITNENIITVNREGTKQSKLYYNGEYKDFVKETHTKFDIIWLDTIAKGKNVFPLFCDTVNKCIKNSSIIGITINTRGWKTRGLSHDTPKGFENAIKKKYINKYDIKKIAIGDNLRLRKICGTINIPLNWAYNGCYGKTGGTLTAFYHFTKKM